MKKFFPIAAIGMWGLATNGCQPSLNNSSVGLNFSNVVIADSLSKLSLFHNAVAWTESLKNEKLILSMRDSILGKLEGKSSYCVYSQSGILKKLSGKISYQIFIEVKDNKYRYQLCDFIFYYYKQDRFYNMVETGKAKPLSERNAPGWQKLWDNHRSTTNIKMLEYCKQLESKMLEKPKTFGKAAVIKKPEW